MKNVVHLFYIGALAATLATFAACENSAKDNTEEASEAGSGADAKQGKTSKNPQDGCYIRVTGQQLRDTLYVQLHVKGNDVTGRMVDEIWEKDSRKGDLKGTVQPDKTIKAVWTFMQEGTTDTMSVAFKMDHTGLLQKPLKADPNTGRQMTDESAAYSVALKPGDCIK